jgi:hypothetical protein
MKLKANKEKTPYVVFHDSPSAVWYWSLSLFPEMP